MIVLCQYYSTFIYFWQLFTLYFGTNILIQCPVPSASSCLLHVYVLQNIHIKWNPNGIKTDGAYFWNIWKNPEEKSTRDGARGGHETGAHAHSRWARPQPPGPLVRRLIPFFGRKKANFWKNIWVKVSIQSELRISRYKRNGEGAESGNAETERDKEIDLISEGLPPPSKPWEPRTRGETLLPYREKVK